MNLIDWLPSITTAGLVATVFWLSRNLIATRLTKSVQHEFDKKLESIRTNLRESEEVLKADLRAKETQISSLRSGAISAMASRQIALDRRRLEAVDQLWSTFTILSSAKNVSRVISGYDFEKLLEESARNQRLRESFKIVGNFVDVKKLDLSGSTKARPFVTPMAWAIFSAYQAIIMQGVAKVELVTSGIGKNFLDKDATIELIKAALPHHEEYINKCGDSGYHFLLEELEATLLVEIQRMLAGESSDKASIEQAALILKLSNEVLDSTKQDSNPMNAELEAVATKVSQS